MSDDFLSQIQNTENKAETLIEKAKEKGQKDLAKEQKVLTEGRAKKLDESRNKAKQLIADKQKKMRDLYEQEINKEQKKVDMIEREAEQKKDKVVSTTYLYLINDLI